jgi:hypothetical protein
MNNNPENRKDLKMENRNTNETAQQAYETAIQDISHLIGWLQCELSNIPEKIHWGHVGTLNTIRADLMEILTFKSGFDLDSLKEALEDARI